MDFLKSNPGRYFGLNERFPVRLFVIYLVSLAMFKTLGGMVVIFT